MTEQHRRRGSATNDARITLIVSGMDCPSCAANVEKAMAQVPGVSDLRLDFAQQVLSFKQGSSTDTSAAVAALRRLGYGVEHVSDSSGA